MPVFRLGVHKAYGSINSARVWGNYYWINAVGPEAGLIQGQVIAAAEAAFHGTNVHFTHLTLSDPTHAFNGRRYEFDDLAGERVVVGSAIPDWNVASVLFQDLDFSRPERKFYRIEIGEADTDGGTLVSGVQDLIQGVLDTLIEGGSAPCTPTGGTITAAVVSHFIGMRQQHWSRRSRPGFKRGYVPA